MEKTLVIVKPGAVQRGLIGEVIKRFEQKGLQIRGIKMIQLTDELLNEHYAHLADKPFFGRIKAAMTATPVIVCCLEGKDAVEVVHDMAGATNGRKAAFGTIRGDFSMSIQENIIHTSDSIENGITELKRFFKEEEIFDYKLTNLGFIYSGDELN
ncbi:MAG TPA: nucleoside-diphosphate kinase [Paludibacter sp.]|nr:nucleoside-diphosphate kinase [Paludibacter sp.]